MPIDPSDSLAIVTLEGLFVICKHDRLSRWAIGVPEVPSEDCHHSLTLQISTYTGGGNPTTEIISLSQNRNLEIITEPSENEVEFFPPSGVFDPATADPHDYRWIIDLEERRFHHEGVDARPDVARHYKRKIFIYGGQLYTFEKSVENYNRIRNTGGSLPLGKIGLSAGILFPRFLSEVNIKYEDVDQPIKTLPKQTGVRYQVSLKHICPPAPGRVSNDFDLYYDILVGRDGSRFQISTGGAGLRGAEEPQVCNVVVLGQTDRLPGV